MPTLSVTGVMGATGATGVPSSFGVLGSIALTVLIAMVVAVLAIAAVVLILRRRRAVDADPGRPRTVADLVRLRAEEEDSSRPTPVPAAVPSEEDGPADVEAVPVAEAEPVEDAAADSAEGATEPDPMVEVPVVPSPPPRAPAGTEGDTPWARAAAMAGDDSVWIPPAEVAAPPAREPAKQPSPVMRLVRTDADLPVAPAVPAPIAAAPIAAPIAADRDDVWSSWADWAEVDADENDDHPAPANLHFPLSSTAGPTGTVPALALLTPDPGVVAGPDDGGSSAGTDVAPPPRVRRSDSETAAEQAAADLALLRTFGFADPSLRPDNAPVVSLVPAVPGTAPVEGFGPAQSVRFRALARDGSGVAGAGVALLDDRGRESSTATADADGRGELRAPRPGTYVVVSTAPDHQPGAVAITVSDAAVDAEVLLARSASLGGSVSGEDGPIAGARLTLVQDGEIVDAVDSAADGTYRIEDLGAGEYGLSVAAPGCEPIAVLLDVPDGIDHVHDVDLDPAGRPGPDRSLSEDDDDDRAALAR